MTVVRAGGVPQTEIVLAERPNPYAGLATRTVAFALDAAIINAVGWAVAAVLTLCFSLVSIPEDVRNVLVAIGAVVALLWAAGYFVFFWSATGQTPGNRVLGIRVQDARTGLPIPGRRAVVRLLALLLAAVPFCAGFLMILFDERRRALQDRIARTTVVYLIPSSPRRNGRER